MEPTVFCPYPRRLESLMVYRCHYKGSTLFSVILSPWVLVRQGFEPATSHSADRRSPNWAYNQAAVKLYINIQISNALLFHSTQENYISNLQNIHYYFCLTTSIFKLLFTCKDTRNSGHETLYSSNGHSSLLILHLMDKFLHLWKKKTFTSGSVSSVLTLKTAAL